MGAASCKNQRNSTITPTIIPVSTNKIYQEMADKGLIFMLEFNIGYSGHTQADLLSAWSKEIQQVLESKKNGDVLQAWKVNYLTNLFFKSKQGYRIYSLFHLYQEISFYFI